MLVFQHFTLVLSGIVGNFGCKNFLPCTIQYSGQLSVLLKRIASAGNQAVLRCILTSEVVDSKLVAGKKSVTVLQGDSFVH